MRYVIKGIIIFCLLFIVIWSYQKYFVRNITSIDLVVDSCKDIFSSKWELEDAAIRDSDTIVVSFYVKDRDDQDWYPNMVETYRALVNILFEDQDSSYEKYKLDIEFNVQAGGSFEIIYDSQNQYMTIWNSIRRKDINISIDAVAETFPETNELMFHIADYSDIEIFSNFTELQKLTLFDELTQDEINYLQSILPNCEIYYSN